MYKVLVTARSFVNSKKAIELLEKENYEIIYNSKDRPLKEYELLELINGINAIIAGVDEITEKVIAKAMPTLKIIARHGVGVDNVDLVAAKKYGVVVSNTPGANSIAVAELTIGLMLALARHVTIINREIRKNSWQRILGTELNNKTLGVIGLGNIGCEVVKRLISFNMKILAFDKYKNKEMIENYKIKYTTLDELLEQSDFITLHLNVTDETKGIINKHTLERMKKNAFLINVARGELIVEEDLVNALNDKKIAGVALDVFENEPLRDSHFFKFENVILTSHVGAYTAESVERMATMAADEVIRVLGGGKPENKVV
jgi:D-3-phosphoglycerate dehydrogenase